MVSIYEPYIWRFCSIRTRVISGIGHRKSLRFKTAQLDMNLSTGLMWFPYNTPALDWITGSQQDSIPPSLRGSKHVYRSSLS